MNEADGQAQFDTAENVLVVTLPVVNPEKKALCEVTMQPSVVDITPSLEMNNQINSQNSDNLDSNLDTQSQLTDKNVINNGVLDDPDSSMLSNTFPRNDDDVNDDSTLDDDTMLVNIDTVRELLKKDFNDTSNNIDVEFDTSNFTCMLFIFYFLYS